MPKKSNLKKRTSKKSGVLISKKISAKKNDLEALFSGLPEKKISAKPRTARTSPHLLDLREIALREEAAKMQRDGRVNRSAGMNPPMFEIRKTDDRKSNRILSALPRKKQPAKAYDFIMPAETKVSNLEGHHLLLQKKANPLAKKAKQILPTRHIFSLQNFLAAVKTPRLALPRIKWPEINIRLPRLALAFQPLHHSTFKPVAVFALLSMLIVSPLLAYDYKQDLESTRTKVLGLANDGVQHLKRSATTGQLKDYISTQYELDAARDQFTKAKEELDSIPAGLQAGLSALPQGEQLAAAKKLLEIAAVLSDVSAQVIGVFDADSDQASLTAKIAVIQKALEDNQQRLKDAGKLAAEIDPKILPEEYRETLTTVLQTLPLLTDNVTAIVGQIDILNELLASSEPRRYLILFQNNNELRPTGGFLGSYAEVDIFRGQITKMNIPSGGFYDLEAGLKANVEPPKPLRALNERWEIQDANYFPDFASSAQKILWFYQKSGGPSVDGVISVNATFLRDLLEVTGPLTTTDGELNSNNVLDELQYATELGPDKGTEHPKRLISEIAPALLSRMLTDKTENLSPKLHLLEKALRSQDIQMYFTSPDLQQAAENYHWAGRLIETNGDYLQIVSTNIAGGKTNRFLKDEVSLDIRFNDDGSSTHTLTLTRTHNGPLNHPLYGVKNNDYLRFYVPSGSTFVSAQGFEPLPQDAFRTASFPTEKDADIGLQAGTTKTDPSSQTETYEESGKTVFANWMQVDVGQTKTITLTYTVPALQTQKEQAPRDWKSFLKMEFANPTRYEPFSLVIQKQSGKENQSYSVNIQAPSNTTVAWAYPAAAAINDTAVNISQLPLEHSVFIGSLFQTQQ